MNDLRSVIRRAGMRMAVGAFGRSLLVTSTGVVCVLLALLVAQRLLAFAVDWRLAWIIGSGAAALGAVAWTWLRRPDSLAVARAVDERANLREAISTALCVADHQDSWSQATVQHAADAARRVVIRKVFPARAPRTWPAPLIAVGVFALVALLAPQGDLLGMLARAEAKEQQANALKQVLAEVKASDEALKKELAKVNDPALEEGLSEEADAPKPQTPDEVRQTAIKKLTAVGDRLAEIRQSDKGQQLDALKEQLSQLRQPGPGPLNDVVGALQQGDLSKASEELAKLADKLASGDLSAAEKEALRKQIEALAKQLEALSKQQGELGRKLAEMGLDPSLASDPEALKKALDQMAGLTEEQKKQLLDACKAGAEACKACQGMSGKLGQALQDMMQGGMGAASLDQLGGMLDEMEMLAQEMAAAEAAMNQIAQRLQSLGQCNGQGSGQNKFDMWQLWTKQGKSRGEGDGSPRDSQQADFLTKKDKANAPTQAGPTIATRLVQGDQIKGESKAQFVEVVEAGSAAATEAIENNLIPREHQEAVKSYFGRLGKKVQAQEAAEPTPPPEKAPSPG